jgi:hypothetical protein
MRLRCMSTLKTAAEPTCTTASGPYLSPKYGFGPAATIWRHRGSSSVNYPTGIKPLPPPDGLAVGRLDGSAKWVKWASLASYTNYDIMRYEPR